jgi:hypothetical protein
MAIPFKQYLESKEKLRKALSETSKITKVYKVKKYCKLPINENDKKEYFALKPNDDIEILWEYDNKMEGTPLKITSINSDEISKEFSWSKEKFKKWTKDTLSENKA